MRQCPSRSTSCSASAQSWAKILVWIICDTQAPKRICLPVVGPWWLRRVMHIESPVSNPSSVDVRNEIDHSARRDERQTRNGQEPGELVEACVLRSLVRRFRRRGCTPAGDRCGRASPRYAHHGTNRQQEYVAQEPLPARTNAVDDIAASSTCHGRRVARSGPHIIGRSSLSLSIRVRSANSAAALRIKSFMRFGTTGSDL